ncbi:MAG TPA: hypothetical protein VGZ00_02510 [Candidatus Baltobacteraceae bacterium]|jgi:hypothetical protein|nr:hypothetical protein [Candidatus Baltobacteraceae bacterium]
MEHLIRKARIRLRACASPHILSSILSAIVVVIVLVAAQNLTLAAYFPHLTRVATDFSSTYLRRELSALASSSPQTIFLGDSVVWGYRLPSDATAIARLTSEGFACRNFAFKSGSPPNFYALARLFQNSGVHPKAVVLEINQKVFNPADSSYASLHPAVADLASPLLSAEDRTLLKLQAPTGGIKRNLDTLLSSFWLSYAMRADIRGTFAGDGDVAPEKPLTADQFEGTYDLMPLTERNVGVHFLVETVVLLRRSGVPVVAFLTPTNHTLLHDYIDSPAYRENGSYLRRILEQHGVRVLDLDASFSASEFLDEDHLTGAGQRRLAALLAGSLSR